MQTTWFYKWIQSNRQIYQSLNRRKMVDFIESSHNSQTMIRVYSFTVQQTTRNMVNIKNNNKGTEE